MSSPDTVRGAAEPYKFVREEFEKARPVTPDLDTSQQVSAGTRGRHAGPPRLGISDEEEKSSDQEGYESSASHRRDVSPNRATRSSGSKPTTSKYAKDSRPRQRAGKYNDEEDVRLPRSPSRAGRQSRAGRYRSSSRDYHDRSSSRSDQRRTRSKSAQRQSREKSKVEKKSKPSRSSKNAPKKKQPVTKRASAARPDQSSTADTNEDPEATGGRRRRENDVAAILREYREAGARSTTLGPRGLNVGASDSERRVIEQSLVFWLGEPAVRTKPPTAGNFLVLDDIELRRRRLHTDSLFLSDETWLCEFDACRVGDPGQVSEAPHLVLLDDLAVVEQFALLQSVLHDAGFSFRNLVPDFDQRKRTRKLSPTAIQQAIFEGRWAIGEEVAQFFQARQASPAVTAPPMPVGGVVATPAQRVVDPNAIRKPVSILSSSDWSGRRASSEYAEEMSDVEQLADAANRVPVLERDTFFRRHGLGESSTQRQVPPASVNPPHVPRPAAFDEPMRQVAAPASQARHPSQVQTHSALAASAPTWRPPAPDAATRIAQDAERPAYQGHAAHQVANQGQVYVAQAARPFIPYRYLDQFYGDESLADRRSWWEEYRYLASTGQWIDAEKCGHLKLFLKKPARSWYQQLGEQRRSWSALSEAFRQEFLVAREAGYEKYFFLAQEKNETPRQYLWRLNSAASEAGISLVGATAVERHVNRFIRSIGDSEVKAMLTSQSFKDVKDLAVKLRMIEDRVKASNSDEPRRTGSRDRDRDRDRDRTRDRSVSRGSAYWAYSEEDSDNEYGRRGHHEGRRPSHDVERSVHFQDDDVYDSEPDSGSVYQSIASRPRQYPGLSSGRSSGITKFGERNRGNFGARRDQCHECGELGHWSAECPSKPPKPVCTVCKGSHPAENCWKKCPACGQAHATPSECEFQKALADLKTWYKAEASAGGNVMLPASILQHLN